MSGGTGEGDGRHGLRRQKRIMKVVLSMTKEKVDENEVGGSRIIRSESFPTAPKHQEDHGFMLIAFLTNCQVFFTFLSFFLFLLLTS